MRARNAAAIVVTCGLVLAPQLIASAAASPSRSNTKHVSAAPAAGENDGAREAQPSRPLRTSGPKAGATRRAEERDTPLAATAPRYDFAGRISCVPYARMVSGIEIIGNGGTWWNNAAGLYQRGHRPEVGSVLVFRPSGGMRLGHVAVVERQVSAREITVHHANWEGPGIRKGTVTRDIAVIDVSDNNDWTEVRVQIGREPGSFGRVYPTYGFVFNRPEGGAPRGPILVRAGGAMQEVAEAPAPSAHLRFINTSIGGLGIEGGR